MEILSKQQLKNLSYWDCVKYYQELKAYKFGNIKEGTPLVVRFASGRVYVFEYRLCTDGFSHHVYGKGACHGYLPSEVEIATKDDIDEYIKRKQEQFNNELKYLEGLKDKVNV